MQQIAKDDRIQGRRKRMTITSPTPIFWQILYFHPIPIKGADYTHQITTRPALRIFRPSYGPDIYNFTKMVRGAIPKRTTC
jgi:hypothetical protein